MNFLSYLLFPTRNRIYDELGMYFFSKQVKPAQSLFYDELRMYFLIFFFSFGYAMNK